MSVTTPFVGLTRVLPKRGVINNLHALIHRRAHPHTGGPVPTAHPHTHTHTQTDTRRTQRRASRRLVKLRCSGTGGTRGS